MLQETHGAVELRMALRNNTRFQMFESCGESLASRLVIALVPVSLGGRYTSQILARGRVLRVRTSDNAGRVTTDWNVHNRATNLSELGMLEVQYPVGTHYDQKTTHSRATSTAGKHHADSALRPPSWYERERSVTVRQPRASEERGEQ